VLVRDRRRRPRCTEGQCRDERGGRLSEDGLVLNHHCRHDGLSWREGRSLSRRSILTTAWLIDPVLCYEVIVFVRNTPTRESSSRSFPRLLWRLVHQIVTCSIGSSTTFGSQERMIVENTISIEAKPNKRTLNYLGRRETEQVGHLDREGATTLQWIGLCRQARSNPGRDGMQQRQRHSMRCRCRCTTESTG
jgi:hypothetical protein